MDKTQTSDEIVSILDDIFKDRRGNIALHEPNFSGNELDYIKDCLDSGWVSSVGSYVDRFEKDLASFTKSSYAIAVVNGTAALHISLLVAGVQPNDEVLIPSLTFVATANAVTYCGAIPHLVDISRDTLGLDPQKLSDYLHEIAVIKQNGFLYNRLTGRRITAVVPMHTFGHPVDLDKLMDVCEMYRLILVEDAAESLGSYYKGKHTGTFGQISALSFNGNKVITTGGGGAVLTNNPDWAKRAKHLTTTAKVSHHWRFNHDEIGYNYRLPNLNAALGCAQLERLPVLLNMKRKLASLYNERLSQVNGISFVSEPQFAESNYWLNAIRLSGSNRELRDAILEKTNGLGIMTRPTWTAMHNLEIYKHCPKMSLEVTEEMEESLINIPSSPSLLNLFKMGSK